MDVGDFLQFQGPFQGHWKMNTHAAEKSIGGQPQIPRGVSQAIFHRDEVDQDFKKDKMKTMQTHSYSAVVKVMKEFRKIYQSQRYQQDKLILNAVVYVVSQQQKE